MLPVAAPVRPAPVRTRGTPGLPALLVALALAAVTPVLASSPAHAQDEEPAPRVRPLPGPGARPILPGPRAVPASPTDDEGAGAGGEEPTTAEDGTTTRGTSGGNSSSAKESGDEDGGSEDGKKPSTGKPPVLPARGASVTIDFVNTPITDLIKYFAEITGRNFLLTDDLKGEVTIISHKPVTVGEAYEAFLSALEAAGYTTVTVGQLTKVVSTSEASSSPLNEYYGSNIPYTDNYVTQIIQLENVSVSDISSVVKELAGKQAKVIAYSPTNTLIITDSAVNIRRVYRIVSQLDVAAPKARLEIIPLQYAQASDVQKIIQEIYGGTASSTESSSSRSTNTTVGSGADRRNRRTPNSPAAATADSASSTTVGKEGSFIDKIITDARTNSLILLANDEALQAIKDLVKRLDINVDPQNEARIYVVYLEHAKAEDVSTVLSNLSEDKSSARTTATNTGRLNRNQPQQTAAQGRNAPADAPAADAPSAVASLDSGVKITSDENTNSLVIVATPDQFRVIEQVIEKLDIRRKQVFVQAVILEMASDDTTSLGFGVHGGIPGDNGELSIASAQLGGSSLGLSAEALSGLALGVYGQPVDVTVDGVGLSIPAFGIAINALASNSAVNIVATPEILTTANEEAKIIVGRNVPFPVSTGRDNNGQPIVSYQREDVATTLKVTPQINESNYVTLEIFQEVTELEEDDSALDPTTAGFITSKRSAETTVVVMDNQTVVIGGLIGSTDTEVETKVPILGDLPLIGNLFRGKRDSSRKTNLLIFLTPHIIDGPADLEEVYRIKWAQREEFVRRFYGKTRAEQQEELSELLRYSMNRVDQPSPWRTKEARKTNTTEIGGDSSTGPSGLVGDDLPPADPASPTASPLPSDATGDDAGSGL